MVAFLLVARRNDDFVENVGVLCAFEGGNSAYASTANDYNFIHFLSFVFIVVLFVNNVSELALLSE